MLTIPCNVSIPYEFTLLSNNPLRELRLSKFLFPTNLHYSQTGQNIIQRGTEFLFPTNLHYSQTIKAHIGTRYEFLFPTNLHYSQTQAAAVSQSI